MRASMCILGMEAQGRRRPNRKSGMFTRPSEMASHCQDLDLQGGHRSPGLLTDADSNPVEVGRRYASKVRAWESQ